MARKVATAVENKLIGGWVTDYTGISFPEHAIVDGENIIFNSDGRVTRRKGFLEEGSGAPVTEGPAITASTTYTWQGVEESSTKTFYISQINNMLRFYDITTSIENLDMSAPVWTLDLNTYVPAGSTLRPALFQCDYTLTTGELVVVNQAIDPLRLTYSKATNTFTVNLVPIKIRDFKGLKTPGFPNDKRTTDTFDNLSANNPRYLYNLVSNGWSAGELRGWDGVRTDLPSQEEFKGNWRNDENDTFDQSKVKDEYATTKIYGGHMVLDAFNPDRTVALAEALTGATTTTDTPGTFTPTDVPNCKGHYPKANPVFKRATALSMALTGHDGALLTVTMYGADSPEAAGVPGNGAIIGSKSFNALVADGTVVTVVTAVDYRYNWYWLEVTTGVAALDCTSYSLDAVVATTTATPVTFGPLADAQERTFTRPSHVCNWSNRIVYAGVNDTEYSTTIYVSKSIEDNERDLGRCYQDNDPTNIKNNQLLPSDGFAIKIPDMVRVNGIAAKGNDLVVLASNGTWVLRGGSEGVSAEMVSVKKLSCVPCDSPCSVVQGDGQPIWWGGDEIWTLVYNIQYHVYETKSLSEKRINNYLRDIPDYNKSLACGAIDCKTNTIYWLYNDGKDKTIAPEVYNKILCLNLDLGAFYRWGGDATGCFRVLAIEHMTQGDRKADSRMKYTVVSEAGGVQFAEEKATDYHDWSTRPCKKNYESWFLSAYAIPGEGVRRVNARYVSVFLDQEDVWGDKRPSLYVRGVYDWDLSGSRWSMKQQAYVPRRMGRTTSVRRVKIRGHGKALQMKFTSEEGHPFSLIGWSMIVSGNSHE